MIETQAEQLQSPDEEVRRLAVVGLAARPFAEVRNSILAALGDGSWRVRKEAVEALLAQPVDDDTIDLLVAMLGANDNAGLRNSAVEALERLGSRAIEALSRHVGEPDHDVRKFIADIMGSIGDAAAVPLLIAALEDPDPNVCAAAAENLGKIADDRAVPYLLQALEKNDLWFRFTILESLSRIGKPVALGAVVALVEEKLLKKAVFDCLGAIGGEDALPVLVEGLKEKAKNAREAAVIALVKVRARLTPADADRLVTEPLREFGGSPVADGLLELLDSPDMSLQEALVTVLGLVGDERAVTRILPACRDEKLRKHGLAALKNMGTTTAAVLLEAFPAADDDDRCFIAYLCGELHILQCAPLLREGMHGKKPLLRKTCALAVGKIGLIELIDELVDLLDDQYPEVRDAAISSLSRLAESARDTVLQVAVALAGAKSCEKRLSAARLLAALHDTEKLSLLVKDEEAIVRKAAVVSLSESSAGISHLVMALADEDVDVRIAAAGALGEFGADEVLDPLLLALQDEDLWVKCAALKSLGKLQNRKALPCIAEIVSRAEGLELLSALEALAEIGGEEVVGLIKKGLENPDEEVVKTAIEILSRSGGDWIDEYQDALLGHSHWDVRRSFINAVAVQRGVEALPLLRAAFRTESDNLVKESITALMNRLQ